MLISDKWRDYELLDCSGGERLERWGEYTLIRPDPQAIWDTPRRRPEWKNPSARYSRSSGSGGGGGAWERNKLPESWIVEYGALRFNVKPMSFKHTGIFPEQAANWDYIAGKIRDAGRCRADNEPLSVLNLFAYTGAATIAAAAAGARVCHVDAARGMVSWARENARTSGLEDAPVRWIVDDCAKFVERELRRGRRYDAVIMDPPSYGRGPSGETWKLEDDIFRFVELVTRVLSDTPEFVIISSYTAGISPATMTYIAETLISRSFGGHAESHELGLLVTETGLILPCGAVMRWEKNA
ncbi:MAG: class I SAM-dependent methyltransferase [Oscillospiraceae bacterium]|jgi:23S rRNA (cytosine1962-C5)-methyltransferase|nr:class I SAM-dependent methyltransferase [Oscillospiraceae bacterium]